MSEDLRRRAEEIFASAFELPPGERTRYVEQACDSDPALRDQVAGLLRDHDQAGGVFLNPDEVRRLTALDGVRGDFEDERRLPPGTIVGDYVIESLLGEGGMGVVYVASQGRPARQVAIKVIRGAFGTRGLVRRFEHEAEVLARLQHPGIAQVLSAGTAMIEGVRRPYIAMELIRGEDLVHHCTQRELSSRERVALMARVCDAVQHAHQRGVIHRDIKPQNILVNEEGQPKVLDFGVARVASREDAMTTIRTSMGQLIGTLAYMSPEQIGGDPAEVDTRSDVYALGVVLYQVLSGRLPHNVSSRSLPEAARIIREEAPERLSRTSRVLRGELETIVAKAIEKDKARRYQSAADLGADLRRYLAGEPILASPDTLYVLGKQIARYRWVVAATLIALIGLAGFSLYASWQASAQRSLALAEQRAREDAEGARRLADNRAIALERALYISRIGHAHAAAAGGDLIRARQQLDACNTEDRGWEWRHIRHLTDESRVIGKVGFNPRFTHASGKASVMAVVDEYGVVRTCDTRTGEERLRVPSDAKYIFAILDPRDERIACVVYQGDVHIVDARTGQRLSVLERPEGKTRSALISSSVAWSSDGRRLAVPSRAGSVLLYQVDQARLEREIDLGNGEILAAKFMGDSGHYAVGTIDRNVRVIDIETGETLVQARVPSQPVAMVCDPAGDRIYLGLFSSTLVAWDWRSSATPSMIGSLDSVPRELLLLGDKVVSTGRHPIIEGWGAENKSRLWLQRGEPAEFRGLFRASDDSHVRTIGLDGTIREWSTAPRGTVPVITTPGRVVFCMDASLDGRTLAFATRDGSIYSANVDAKSYQNQVGAMPDGVRSVGVLRDDSVVAVCDSGVLKVWPADGTPTRSTSVFEPGALHMCLSPDRTTIAVVDGHATLTILRAADLTPIRSIETGLGSVAAHTWHDQVGIVVASGDGRIQQWSPDGLQTAPEIHVEDRIASIGINPDGSMLVVGHENGILTRWRLDTHSKIDKGIQAGSRISSVQFLPDNSRFMTTHADRTIRVWIASYAEIATVLHGHASSVVEVAVLPDDSLATIDSGGTIRLWLTEPLPNP
ncbi:MAG: protein kinase [Phycisphaerales bacterium]|nr:protein kinase [Phycisphaerales bacterium]